MAVETRKPSLPSRLVRKLLMWLYRHHGWVAKGEVPEPRRFIIIAAPHTSNWDFIYYLGLTQAWASRRISWRKSLCSAGRCGISCSTWAG